MTVDIRPARREDLDSLVLAVGEGEYFAHRLARPGVGAVLIAFDGPTPVGAACLVDAFADPVLAEPAHGRPGPGPDSGGPRQVLAARRAGARPSRSPVAGRAGAGDRFACRVTFAPGGTAASGFKD
ncbi:hypothetical protein [Rhizomonospora bruguierae]|uniref:hypothetical protein n=1 Tax=Rhizomonospora bruguierae TaxID=1581705 RepID=UPI001BCE70F3|nr:hypothetical protein [Micromonospora sp. NBRC 107566]